MGNSPLSAEDFNEIKTVSDPQLSPDGTWVAFVHQSVDRNENKYRSAIWLLPTDGGPAKPFTAGTGRDSSPRWSPCGQFLVFVSDRAGDKPQLHLIPVDGGEARSLTKLPNGARAPVWSPDGSRIAFLSSVDAEERAQEESDEEPPSDPDERKLWKERRKLAREKREDPRLITRYPYRNGTSYLGDRYPHVYVVDVPDDLAAKAEKPRRLTDGNRVYDALAWMPDGQAILATVNRDPESLGIAFPTDIVSIPVDGGEPQVIAGTEQQGTHGLPKPSPDGQWIAYLTHSEERFAAQNSRIALAPTAGGEHVLLTKGLDVNVGSYRWHPDSQSIYLSYGQWGNVGISRVALDGQVEALVTGDRQVSGFDVSQDTLAYTITAPDIPADLYLAGESGQDERRCTTVNADWLSERWLSTPEEVRYTLSDGVQVQGWVMHPPDFDPDRKYPLALEIHGGPHAMWGNTFWHEFQVLAGRGYAVFFCNPRGSDGYGQDFRDAIHGCWGEADADDILTGVNGIVQRGYIDDNRLAITGGSYGGYMTAWIIGHDKRFAAAVSQRGVYNLSSFYGVTDIPRFIEAEFDVAPWEDVETLWKYSPIAYVEQIETPLLILHSDLDFRVPVSDGEQLFAALKRLKREVAFLRYPREGHELSRSGEPAHRIDRINRIVDWFDRYTQQVAEKE